MLPLLGALLKAPSSMHAVNQATGAWMLYAIFAGKVRCLACTCCCITHYLCHGSRHVLTPQTPQPSAVAAAQSIGICHVMFIVYIMQADMSPAHSPDQGAVTSSAPKSDPADATTVGMPQCGHTSIGSQDATDKQPGAHLDPEQSPAHALHNPGAAIDRSAQAERAAAPKLGKQPATVTHSGPSALAVIAKPAASDTVTVGQSSVHQAAASGDTAASKPSHAESPACKTGATPQDTAVTVPDGAASPQQHQVHRQPHAPPKEDHMQFGHEQELQRDPASFSRSGNTQQLRDRRIAAVSSHKPHVQAEVSSQVNHTTDTSSAAQVLLDPDPKIDPPARHQLAAASGSKPHSMPDQPLPSLPVLDQLKQKAQASESRSAEDGLTCSYPATIAATLPCTMPTWLASPQQPAGAGNSAGSCVLETQIISATRAYARSLLGGDADSKADAAALADTQHLAPAVSASHATLMGGATAALLDSALQQGPPGIGHQSSTLDLDAVTPEQDMKKEKPAGRQNAAEHPTVHEPGSSKTAWDTSAQQLRQAAASSSQYLRARQVEYGQVSERGKRAAEQDLNQGPLGNTPKRAKSDSPVARAVVAGHTGRALTYHGPSDADLQVCLALLLLG